MLTLNEYQRSLICTSLRVAKSAYQSAQMWMKVKECEELLKVLDTFKQEGSLARRVIVEVK